MQLIESFRDGKSGRILPMMDRDSLALTLPGIAQRYPTFASFAKANVPEILGEQFKPMKMIPVNTTESIPNAQNRVLEDGAKALNLRWGVIPRNGEGCDDCGFCNYGCMSGAKRSTLRTYLTEAHQRGARARPLRSNPKRQYL
jgi:choline dehydrogenase-like flavoprotein